MNSTIQDNDNFVPGEIVSNVSPSESISTPIELQIETAFLEGRNIYISGVGGTGKSYFIKYLFEKYKKGVLTSTTGISAFNIGGRTLHSWAGFILPNYEDDHEKIFKNIIFKIKKDRNLIRRWKFIKCIFIDEISMLGGTYLTLLDAVARVVRKSDNPFGGIQLVCTGDFLQLPPVKDVYPFEVNVWSHLNFVNFNLTKCHRFNDNVYIELLKRARIGKLTHSDILLLKERVNQPIGEICPTILLSKNADVYEKNRNELDKLPGETVIVPAIDEVLDLDGKKINEIIPKEIEDEFQCDKILYLKNKAQVMLTVNSDIENGLVNGSRGVIQRITRSTMDGTIIVDVKFMSGQTFPITTNSFTIKDDDKTYVRKMLPLKLCWATSIHKSQGLTLDCVYVDLGKDLFCPGQGYVALSRCRNIKSLYIKSFIPSKIFPNQKAIDFERTL
jgi:ATP-dependent DNA helicase PIF1